MNLPHGRQATVYSTRGGGQAKVQGSKGGGGPNLVHDHGVVVDRVASPRLGVQPHAQE